MWFAHGPARFSLFAILALSIVLPPARDAAAQTSCPTNPVEIGAPSQYVFPTSQQSNIVFIGWMTMGRRSPTIYAATKYGTIGAYLGSNPADPTFSVQNVSFRAGGPVGGGSTNDCWPGPTGLAAAETGSGSGSVGLTWTGCGSPAQTLVISPPGGQSSFGQQIDPTGTGSTVYGGDVAAAYTSGGKLAEYYVDADATYAVDVSNPSGSAGSTPLRAMQTIPGWAGARVYAVGGATADPYLLGVFAASKTVQVASIGSDGRLAVLPATASLSGSGAAGSGAQKFASYPASNGFYLFFAVSTGIDVVFFNGSTFTSLGTIANTSSTDPYVFIQVPAQAPAPVLLAERRLSHQIDIFGGGFLAGKSGAPALMTSIPALASDPGSGFGAYVAAASPGTLYVYRVTNNNSVLGMQTDTFDISCVMSPPSPNPTAAFTLVDKSAQNRADKASYVGDTFSFTDGSKAGTGGAITNWYVWANYSSTTSNKSNADISATLAPSLPSVVFPCQSLVNGVCSYSPASITSSSISEKFGELVSAGSLDSAVATNSVTLKVPLTRVASRGADGSVKLLTGGAIDASASDGSPTGFAWSFGDAGGAPLSTACAAATCAPPSNAASFTVAAKYAGGYQAAAVSGTIVFTDIAGAITVPATLYSGQSTTTATFALQKGSSVTITGVSYNYDGGALTALSPIPALSSSVSINVPALATGVNHTITFVVTYTGGSLGTSVSFPDTFLYSAVQYAPKVWVSKQASATATDTCSGAFGGAPGSGGTTCSGSPGSFYLSDQGDSGKPAQAATWDFGDGSGLDTSHQTTDFVSHSYSTGTYTVKLTVAGITAAQSLTIGQSSPLSVSITGPGQVTAGSLATFTASVSGGSGPYTYAWSGNGGSPGSGSSASFSTTFSSVGTYAVSLTVHDSSNNSKTASKSLSVVTTGGGTGCTSTTAICIGGPSSVSSGAQGTWTASVYGTSSTYLTIHWSINSVPVSDGATLTHAFTAPGTYTLKASGSKNVGGGGFATLTSATLQVTVTGTTGCGNQCPPIATFSVVGATFTPYASSQYSAKAGDVLLFVADDKGLFTQFAWDFGDSTSGTGATVTHAFTGGGTFTVKLTAKNLAGQSSTVSKFAISGQSFSALIVPGAGHLSSDNPSGAYATELSLFNNSNATVTVALDFETADAGSLDPTKLAFPTSGPGLITLAPNQGWSASAVTDGLLGKDGLGTLFLKYTGPRPSALARIYFSSGEEGAPTYGTYLPVYAINAAGSVLATQAAGSTPPTQSIVGLKFDDPGQYRGGVTIVSAAPTGGRYDVNLFRDDGQQVASLTESIAGYQQVKLGAAEFGLSVPDPDHIYYATVAPSPGFRAPGIAIGTVTDNRTRDSLLLTDDTPVTSAVAGQNATYYVAGAGRYANSKTDLYVLNTSAYPVALRFSFHYLGDGGVHKDADSSVPDALRTVGPGAALQFTDVVTSLFPDVADGLSVGELQIDYTVPSDGGRLVMQGRNYTDTGDGSYGMQLPAYGPGDGLVPGSSGRIVLTGLHNDFSAGSTTDYDYVSRFGFAALGNGLVTVHAEAYDQADGSLFWSGDYSLNTTGYGRFVYIPTTGSNAPAQFAGHPAFNMVVTVPTGDGMTPAAAFATVQDARSRDLVFVPGKPSS